MSIIPKRSYLPDLTGAVVCALLFVGPAFFGIAGDAAIPAKKGAEAPETELRGRIICISEVLRDRYGASLAANHEHLYGLRGADGKIYTLLRTRLSEALFVDKTLHEKDLVLKGRLFPQTMVFESTNMRSLRNGVLHGLYYYCDVCEIETVSPGPCDCCQGPVKLVEKPLK